MKKLTKLLTVLLTTILLTGCVKMNIHLVVNEDKSTSLGLEMLVEESMLTMAQQDPKTYIEEMKKEIASNEQFKGAKVEELSKTIDDAKWIGVKVSAASGGIDAAVEEKDIDGVKSLVLTLPMDKMKDQMDMEDIENSGYSVAQMKKLGLEMTMTIKMPNKVTSNYGTVKDNEVTLDLLTLVTEGKSESIVISSPINSTSYTPIIIGVVALVAVIGGFFLFKKKKSTAKVEEEVNEVVDSVEEENTSHETETKE